MPRTQYIQSAFSYSPTEKMNPETSLLDHDYLPLQMPRQNLILDMYLYPHLHIEEKNLANNFNEYIRVTPCLTVEDSYHTAVQKKKLYKVPLAVSFI